MSLMLLNEINPVFNVFFFIKFSYCFCFRLQALRGAPFGEGTGPILLDNMLCTGNEDSLKNCPHNGWKNHNCYHNEDAAVQCFNTSGETHD